MPAIKGKVVGKYKWDNVLVTKTDLKRMYPAVPMVVITKAVQLGISNFDGLKSLWDEHEKEVRITKAIAQKKSVLHMRGWALNETKRNSRDFPDHFIGRRK